MCGQNYKIYHIAYAVENRSASIEEHNMTATYLLTPGNLLWEILENYGHDPKAVFAEAGVSKAMLIEEGRRVSFNKINALWVRAADIIRDPCFGGI